MSRLSLCSILYFVLTKHCGLQVNSDEAGAGFAEVGALSDAKDALREAVQLPLQHPRLFQRGSLARYPTTLLLLCPLQICCAYSGCKSGYKQQVVTAVHVTSSSNLPLSCLCFSKYSCFTTFCTKFHGLIGRIAVRILPTLANCICKAQLVLRLLLHGSFRVLPKRNSFLACFDLIHAKMPHVCLQLFAMITTLYAYNT